MFYYGGNMRKAAQLLATIVLIPSALLFFPGTSAAQDIRLLSGIVLTNDAPLVGAPINFCAAQKRAVPKCDTRVQQTECRMGPSPNDGCDRIVVTTTDSEGKFAIALPNLSSEKTYFLRAEYPEGEINQPLGTGASVNEWDKEQKISASELDFEGGTPSSISPHREKPTVITPLPEKGTKHVLFATDRLVERRGGDLLISNENDRGEKVMLGTCEVLIDLQAGFNDSLLNVFRDRDASRYYAIRKISEMSKAEFVSAFAGGINKDSSHDALLFVHGYNVSFNDACRRAAQIAYDIKFEGPILLYSWPSHNTWYIYGGDEDMEIWSRPHFDSFLHSLLNQKGLGHLHIIAHSMGNRLVTNALFSKDMTAEEKRHVGEVVLAAPDIFRDVFDQYKHFDQLTHQRVTLYASDHDQALRLSKWFHSDSRAGDANPEVDVQAGLDSVDASAVDTSFFGHSYVGESRPVLEDLSLLISTNREPGKRFGLTGDGQPPKQWWKIKP
jgi:esterase/lipase superfamily enzyme